MKNLDLWIGLTVAVIVCVVVAADPHNWEPCPTEDSNGCYWDGGPNGEGDRFIALSDDLIIYLP